MGEITKIAYRKGVNPRTGRPGPAPSPPRDGDRVQARQRVNVDVRTGRRPHPNDLPCADCGHVCGSDERRHEYHHHLGYEGRHHGDVVALCKRCHAKRDNAVTHCVRGHLYDQANTGRKANGTRFCMECRREFERRRTPRGSEFWRKINSKRRGHG